MHPGEMLLEEFLNPLGLSQSEFARITGVSFPRLNEIVAPEYDGNPPESNWPTCPAAPCRDP